MEEGGWGWKERLDKVQQDKLQRTCIFLIISPSLALRTQTKEIKRTSKICVPATYAHHEFPYMASINTAEEQQ